MVDFISRFDDFRGGDFGREDPSKAQDNQFSGTNIFLYDSELLGVRPGTKAFATTNLPNHPIIGPMGFDIWDDNIIIVLDGPWRIPIDTGIAVSMGDYNSDAVSFVKFAQAEGNLYSTSEGELYKHGAGLDTTVEVPLPAGVELEGVTLWRYRLIGWDKNVPWRLYYSKVAETGAEWDTWEDNAFLDIPTNEPIIALIPWYNVLLVATRSGWWQVSGTIVERPYVRQLTRGNGPDDQRVAAGTSDNRVLYWAREPVPFWFNGETTYLDRRYRVSRANTQMPCQTVIAAPTGRKLLMMAEDTEPEGGDETAMLLYRGNDWSVHDFADKIAGLAPADIRHGYQLPEHVIFGVKLPTGINDPVEIVSWSHNINRPARHDDDWVAPADAGDTLHVQGRYLSPAWYDSQSRMVMVRNIVIQFRKWPCGGTECLNEMHVRIRPLGKYEGGEGWSEPQTWVELSDHADDQGTDDSWRVGVGEQGYAAGFQVEIERMVGVAIRSIEVHVVLGGKRL